MFIVMADHNQFHFSLDLYHVTVALICGPDQCDVRHQYVYITVSEKYIGNMSHHLVF